MIKKLPLLFLLVTVGILVAGGIFVYQTVKKNGDTTFSQNTNISKPSLTKAVPVGKSIYEMMKVEDEVPSGEDLPDPTI